MTSEKTDWDIAKKTCQKMEANLVSIHTLPELEFIIRNLKKGNFLILTYLYLSLVNNPAISSKKNCASPMFYVATSS